MVIDQIKIFDCWDCANGGRNVQTSPKGRKRTKREIKWENRYLSGITQERLYQYTNEILQNMEERGAKKERE